MTRTDHDERARERDGRAETGGMRPEQDTLHATGDFRVPANAAVPTGFSCDGDARIGAGAHVDGDVHARGTVTLGAGARVTGSIRAEGGVTWNPGASAARVHSEGPFRMRDHALAASVSARFGVDWSEEGGA